jgi:hypothetical protein
MVRNRNTKNTINPAREYLSSYKLTSKNKFLILSINMNGNIFEKLHDLRDIINRTQPDIIAIQELHVLEQDEKYLQNIHKDFALFSNLVPFEKINTFAPKGTKDYVSNRQGVITLVKNAIAHRIKEKNILKDDVTFRYIIINFEISNQVFAHANVYAPSGQECYNDSFFTDFNQKLKDLETKYKKKTKTINWIISGDCNAYFDSDIDHVNYEKQEVKHIPSYKQFKKFSRDRNLKDSMRILLGKKRVYTHSKINKDPNSTLTYRYKSRLDYHLISKRLKNKLIKFFTINEIQSDHKMIGLILDVNIPTYEKTAIYHRPKYKINKKDEEKINNIFQNQQLSESLKEKVNFLKEKNGNIPVLFLNQIQTEFNNEITKKMNENFQMTSEYSIIDKTKQIDFILKDERLIQLKNAKKMIEKNISKMNKIVQNKLNDSKAETQNLKNSIFNITNKYFKDEAIDPEYCREQTLTKKDKELLIKNRKRFKNMVSKRIKILKWKQIQKRAELYAEWAQDNPKKLFKAMKLVFKKNIDVDTPILDEKNKRLIFDKTEKLESKRKFWKHILREKNKKPDNFENWIKSFIEDMNYIYKINTNDISFEEFIRILKKVKKFTSPGIDNIGYEVICNLSPEYLDALYWIFRTCFKIKQIPENWKQIFIVELPKDGDLRLNQNYRPISLLSCQYKIYTNILTERLTKYLEKNNILVWYQHGFRKGKNTINAIKVLKFIIEDSITFKSDLHLLYIDIKKAFDSVPIWSIGEILKAYKVDSMFIEVINSLYHNTKAVIGNSDGVSRFFSIRSGVRQGDPLSPLLFILFINPLLSKLLRENKGYVLRNSKERIPILAFADDTVLIAKNRAEMESIIQTTLQYFEVFAIEVNPSKSAYTYRSKNHIFDNIKLKEQHPKFLNTNQSYKYLGVHINLNLNWDKHCKYLDSKLENIFINIKQNNLPSELVVLIANKLLNPLLTYTSQILLYPEKWIKKWNSNFTTTVKHSIGVRKSAKGNKLLVNNLFNLKLPGTEATKFFIDSMINKTLNEGNEDKNLLKNRIDNSKILKCTEQHDLNTFQNISKDIIRQPQEDTISTLTKAVADSGLDIKNKIYRQTLLINHIDDENYYIIDKLIKKGVFDMLQLLTQTNQLLNDEQICKIHKFKLSCYEKSLISKIYDKIKTDTQNWQNITKEIGNDNIKIKTIEINNENINQQFYTIMFNKNTEVWQWTDGSTIEQNDTIKSGIGCFFNDNSDLNISINSEWLQNNTYAEMKAIFLTLKTIKKYRKQLHENNIQVVRIFTDSKCSKIMIKNFVQSPIIDKAYINSKFFELLNRTKKIIILLQDTFTIKFTHIPSHMSIEERERTLHSAKGENKLKRYNKIMKKFNNNYDIIQGNVNADILASRGTHDTFRNQKTVNIPKGIKDYILLDAKGQMIPGNIKPIIEKNINDTYLERFKPILTEEFITNHNVNLNYSNFIFDYKKGILFHGSFFQRSRLKNMFFKLRTGILPLRKYLCKRVKRNKHLYKSPYCIFCNTRNNFQKETFYHFLMECTYFRKYTNKFRMHINQLLSNYLGTNFQINTTELEALFRMTVSNNLLNLLTERFKYQQCLNIQNYPNPHDVVVKIQKDTIAYVLNILQIRNKKFHNSDWNRTRLHHADKAYEKAQNNTIQVNTLENNNSQQDHNDLQTNQMQMQITPIKWKILTKEDINNKRRRRKYVRNRKNNLKKTKSNKRKCYVLDPVDIHEENQPFHSQDENQNEEARLLSRKKKKKKIKKPDIIQDNAKEIRLTRNKNKKRRKKKQNIYEDKSQKEKAQLSIKKKKRKKIQMPDIRDDVTQEIQLTKNKKKKKKKKQQNIFDPINDHD